MKQIKISEILALLKSGTTREEIKRQYELSSVDAKALFEHEKLKGIKVAKKLGITIVDDLIVQQAVTQLTLPLAMANSNSTESDMA